MLSFANVAKTLDGKDKEVQLLMLEVYRESLRVQAQQVSPGGCRVISFSVLGMVLFILIVWSYMWAL